MTSSQGACSGSGLGDGGAGQGLCSAAKSTSPPLVPPSRRRAWPQIAAAVLLLLGPLVISCQPFRRVGDGQLHFMGQLVTSMDTEAASISGRAGPSPMDVSVVADIFRRHCGWEPAGEALSALGNASVPLLISTAMQHCSGSTALPFISVDLWHHHADVRILRGSSVEEVEDAIRKASCNSMTRKEACIVFMLTELLTDEALGPPLLLRVMTQPFVLITSSNDDTCVPPATPDADHLLRSPLLLRWFTKNLCNTAGDGAGKLVPLPIGPKWQWQSVELDGEDKAAVKQRLLAAGAGDPEALFRSAGRERSVFVELNPSTSDAALYRPARKVRRYFLDHLRRGDVLPDHLPTSSSNASTMAASFCMDKPRSTLDPTAYLQALSQSTFVLAPPGRGLDTLRAWEALMLGAVPIVLRSPLLPLYEGLPVLVLDGVKQLQQDRLQSFYQESRGKHYDWRRVTGLYWLHLISSEARRGRV